MQQVLGSIQAGRVGSMGGTVASQSSALEHHHARRVRQEEKAGHRHRHARGIQGLACVACSHFVHQWWGWDPIQP